ncbi:hypothetical protein [Glutamicibacter sp. NPDC087344]|uniref:hypothetical protein n=1 Tax=Glutamicibacter sp. NPDC087344 TaxID=3363994 RepID=UPI0037FC31BF
MINQTSIKNLASIHLVGHESHHGETVEAAIRSAFGPTAFYYPAQDRNDPCDGQFVVPNGSGIDVLGRGRVEGPREPKVSPDQEPITSAHELVKLI